MNIKLTSIKYENKHINYIYIQEMHKKISHYMNSQIEYMKIDYDSMYSIFELCILSNYILHVLIFNILLFIIHSSFNHNQFR